MAVYKEFRSQYDARQYAAAKPLAEKLVQLTEEQYGPEELVLTNPLTNLATVNYKLGNYPAAIENYQRTLRILQAKSTIADKQQIRPLHGLGISFMGANDPESAVVALKRAADLSRNTDGLFNINQMEFIDALISAYAATGRWPEAEKEALYALRIEEAAYGRTSIKLLDRLDKLARWYEADRRYTSERNTYERALAILQKNAPENDLRRVGAAARHRARVPPRGVLRRGGCRHRRWHIQPGHGRAGIHGRHAAAARRERPEHGDGHHRLQFAGRPADARRGAHRSRRLVPDRERVATCI